MAERSAASSVRPGATRRLRARRGGIWLVVAVAAALVVPTGAGAVHNDGVGTDLFELGPTNALTDLDDDVANIPDWAELFTSTGARKDTDGDGTTDDKELFGGEATFVVDDLATGGGDDETSFAESNKNNELIGTWNWDTGQVPAKNDLSNVYAYAKKNASNQLVVYAATERLSTNGDTHVDLEFNQDDISPDRDVPCGDDGTGGAADGSPCEFLGEKRVNDVIVSLDYVKGGDFGALEVRRWNGSDYVEIVKLNGTGCNDADDIPNEPADVVCAFTNEVAVDGGPWTNYDTGGETTMLKPNAFAEFGINVTELLGVTPCFATFNAHTRTSQSFTASLTDWAIGDFELCQPSTILSVASSPANTTVYQGGSVTLTFSELNDGNTALAKPASTEFVTIDTSASTSPDDTLCTPDDVLGTSNAAPPAGDGGNPSSDATHNVGDLNNNDKLDPLETFQFSCTFTATGSGTIVGIGHGIETGLTADPVDVTYCSGTANGLLPAFPGKFCDPQERTSITVSLLNPGTELLKTASASVTYTYTEENKGNTQLEAPDANDKDPKQTDGNGGWVVDNQCSPVLHVLGSANATPTSDADHNVGDLDNDNVLDPGEKWTFTCVKTIAGPTGTGSVSTVLRNVAIGHGKVPASIDANQPDVTWCDENETSTLTKRCDSRERDVLTVTIANGTSTTSSTP